MIHDAFQPLSYWQNFMPSPQYEGVILDTHIYQVFDDGVSAAITLAQGCIIN
jgi:glucan 1,3-beta-glucosidase